MGLCSEFRAIARGEVPAAFRRTSPARGQAFDAVLCDMEQVVFRLPPGYKNRRSVFTASIDHFATMARICRDSAEPDAPSPTVYAIFDSPAKVTTAKQPCQLERFKRGKTCPPNAEALVKDYIAGVKIACDWWSFLAFGPARKAVISCLAEDLAREATAALSEQAVFVLDPPSGPGPTDGGEAELKSQLLALRHTGSGVILDSSDSDIIAMWLIMGSLLRCSNGKYRQNVCIRSVVSGGKKAPSYSDMVGALVCDRGLTEAEAQQELAGIGITYDMRSEDMPDDVPTKYTTVTEYADLNMLHSGITEGAHNRGCSMAFVGLLCGSDLVLGAHSSPLPNVGAGTAIKFYLDNTVAIGSIASCTRGKNPDEMELSCSTKAFWKFVRLLYWSKQKSKMTNTKSGVIPTYTQLEAASHKGCKTLSRCMASKKALTVTFVNCRYALGYYGSGKIVDPIASSGESGLSINGWYKDRGDVVRIPDWPHDLEEDNVIEWPDEMKLHDQDKLMYWADARMPWTESAPRSLPRQSDIKRPAVCRDKPRNTGIKRKATPPLPVDEPMWDDEVCPPVSPREWERGHDKVEDKSQPRGLGVDVGKNLDACMLDAMPEPKNRSRTIDWDSLGIEGDISMPEPICDLPQDSPIEMQPTPRVNETVRSPTKWFSKAKRRKSDRSDKQNV